MSNAPEKHPWVCPGCQRKFLITAGKSSPEFCPNCTRERSTAEIAIVVPPLIQEPAKESLADPDKAKWRPLAVVLPQEPTELNHSLEAMRVRRFYADLAWRVTRFWFVVIFGPASVASLVIHPGIGLIALTVFGGIVVALSLPASGALRE